MRITTKRIVITTVTTLLTLITALTLSHAEFAPDISPLIGFTSTKTEEIVDNTLRLDLTDAIEGVGNEYKFEGTEVTILEKKEYETEFKPYLDRNGNMNKNKIFWSSENNNKMLDLDLGNTSDYRTAAQYKVAYRIYVSPTSSDELYIIDENNGKDGYKLMKDFYFMANRPPQIFLNTPKNDTWYSENEGRDVMKVTGTVKDDDLDDLLGIKYRINNGTFKIGKLITSNGSLQQFEFDVDVLSLEDGFHTIEIWVEDDKGGKSSLNTRNFGVDRQYTDLEITPKPEPEWINANKLLSITHTDNGDSGIETKRFVITEKPDREILSGWENLIHTSQDIEINREGLQYVHAQIIDGAGNESYEIEGPYKLDKTMPLDYKIDTLEVTPTSIEINVLDVEDDMSGIHDISPYSYSTDGGSNWTDWMSDNKYKIEDLNTNHMYEIRVRVRDNANNYREKSINTSTLTKPIKLTYNREPDSTEIDLAVNLDGNPPDTEVMITRQNLISKEQVTLRDWSTALNFRDRVQSFIEGYKYTAYAKNKDGIVGEPASVEVKDPEEPYLKIRGTGNDKYIFDSNNKSLFKFGGDSGNIVWQAETIASEYIKARIYDEAGSLIQETDKYGRVGEYRYEFVSPTQRNEKEVYTIKLYNGDDQEMVSYNVTVYNLSSVSDIYDFEVKPNGTNMDITYIDKSSYRNSIYHEIANNPKIQSELLSVMIPSTNPPTELAKNGTRTVPQGDLTIQKEMGGGTYSETFKQNSVSVTTNISPFVTNLEEEWQLEVYVTSPKGRFTLPRDMTEFSEAGYTVEVSVAENKTSINGDSEPEKYQNILNAGSTVNMNTYRITEPTIATVGIKVTDVLPTYHTTNLNLQNQGEGGASTLDAIGNSNIKYDGTFIYNRMNNVMKPHGESVYDNINNKWTGTLYHRQGANGNKLLLITKGKIKVLKSSTLEVEDEIMQTNTGSAIAGSELYLSTSDGLKQVNNNGTLHSTAFTKSVNALDSDGFNLYVASNEGLHVLSNSLSETQFISNEEIFGNNTQIKSLYTSSGNIYVSKDVDGNEYVVLGK